jgi:hypothetical protein
VCSGGPCKHNNEFVTRKPFEIRKNEVLFHAIKACKGRGAEAPGLLNLGIVKLSQSSFIFVKNQIFITMFIEFAHMNVLDT